LINDWWDEVKDDYEYCVSPLEDYEPTDLEMQQQFGVAWHDAI